MQSFLWFSGRDERKHGVYLVDESERVDLMEDLHARFGSCLVMNDDDNEITLSIRDSHPMASRHFKTTTVGEKEKYNAYPIDNHRFYDQLLNCLLIRLIGSMDYY